MGCIEDTQASGAFEEFGNLDNGRLAETLSESAIDSPANIVIVVISSK